MEASTRLREQLVRLLDWEEAHVGLEKALAGLPADLRGTRAPGFEHTVWQLFEHMRLAQKDILDFCVNPRYVHELAWPEDYWPKAPAPADASAWDQAVVGFTTDRQALKTLVSDPAVDLLAAVPTGKDRHTYLRAILLVADHNAYHLGQLVAVRKALGSWG